VTGSRPRRNRPDDGMNVSITDSGRSAFSRLHGFRLTIHPGAGRVVEIARINSPMPTPAGAAKTTPAWSAYITIE
jgi:hypothetical protein